MVAKNVADACRAFSPCGALGGIGASDARPARNAIDARDHILVQAVCMRLLASQLGCGAMGLVLTCQCRIDLEPRDVEEPGEEAPDGGDDDGDDDGAPGEEPPATPELRVHNWSPTDVDAAPATPEFRVHGYVPADAGPACAVARPTAAADLQMIQSVWQEPDPLPMECSVVPAMALSTSL